MRRTDMKLALILAMLAVCGSSLALEVPLKYVSYSDDSRGFSPSGYARVKMQADAPDGDWKLPELGKHPVYGQVTLGDQKHLVVLDDKTRDSGLYDRLYFDANANRDLTDDAVIYGTSTKQNDGRNMHGNFPATDMTIVVDGREMPFRFNPSTYCYKNEPDEPATHKRNLVNFGFTVRSRCGYEGSFKSSGKSYRFMLCDRDSNGRFADCLRRAEDQPDDGRLRVSGDLVYLGGSDEVFGYTCGQYLGDYLVVEKTLYGVVIDTVAGTMTLTPMPEADAMLKFREETDRLSVTSTDGAHHVMMVQPDKAVPVPAGSYQLHDYLLHAKDPQGDRWRLQANGTQASPVVEAVAGKTMKLTFGEPFTPVVKANTWTLRSFQEGHSKEMRLEFGIVGHANEQVSDLRRVSGSKTKIKLASERNGATPYRPAEPTYKVIKPDGEVVTQGSFEYG